jgi:hypothetical protein
MPDILDSYAPIGVSEPRLNLANCLWEVTSPQTILNASSLGARERLQWLLERYRRLLASLGLLEALEAVVSSQSLFARFMLVHAPFEFLLAQLEEDPQREREDHDYLEERVKLMCLAPCLVSGVPFTMALRKRFLLKPVPIHYTNLILDLREFPRDEFVITSLNGTVRFPGESSPHDFTWDESLCLLRFSMGHAPFLLRNPADYVVYSSKNISESVKLLCEDGPTYELQYRGELYEEIVEIIETAHALIQAFQPPLLKELRFFIRAYGMDTSWEGKGEVLYSSIWWQPGLIQMTPDLLGESEGIKIGKRGDPLLTMLVAAQFIHEGLHQKHFYLNSCEDTNPINHDQRGSIRRGFIRPEFSGVQMTCTWGVNHCLNEFFNIALSVGFEILFLEFLLRTQRLRSEEQDFFKRRLKRKRSYLLPLLVQAELLRHYFSPEGELVLGELLRLFGYRTT